MRLFVVLVFVCFMSGCAGFGGVTEYKITTPDGVLLEVRNTKDYQSYKLTAKKAVDGSYSVRLDETGVSASDPMAIMAKQNELILNKILDAIP